VQLLPSPHEALGLIDYFRLPSLHRRYPLFEGADHWAAFPTFLQRLHLFSNAIQLGIYLLNVSREFFPVHSAIPTCHTQLATCLRRRWKRDIPVAEVERRPGAIPGCAREMWAAVNSVKLL
jgi:hypothetical protein